MWFDSIFSTSSALNKARIEKLESYHTRTFSPMLWIMLFGLLGFGYWSYHFLIDEVAKAGGEVIASSRVQLIQAVDGGVLASLDVKEGDYVEQGQVLARLDDTRFSASVLEIEARLSALLAKQTRLRAEVKRSKNLVFSDRLKAYPELIEVEQALFKQRRGGLYQELSNLNKSIQLAKEEVDLLKQLKKSGDVNRSEVIRTERQLNEAQSKRTIRENEFYEEVNKELTKVEDEIAQNEQVLAQRKQQLKDSVFVAKLAGIVKNIRVTTVGGVLRSGEELMEIIPVNDELIVEAKVSPTDISRVQKGLPAMLKFDPFDYTIFGSVEAEVVYVSPDTLKEEGQQGEEVYYRAHIKLPQNPVITNTGKELEVLPGMTAQVDIKTGTRTVLDYLLKPVRKTLAESLGER